MVASGMSDPEIAEVLGVSGHAIRQRLFRAYVKLGCSGRRSVIWAHSHLSCCLTD